MAQATDVQFADVEAAARGLAGNAVRTPLVRNAVLDARLGGRVFLKCESLQHIGAFKFRGAFWALACLDDDVRSRGVVAWSSGNHAQGVAMAAQRFGVPATIVMPHDAPALKRDRTRRFGAEVVGYDRAIESREDIACAIANREGRAVVPPFDHPHVIAGQGTVGLEIAQQLAELGETPDQAVVPCGGGGLTAGVATAMKHLHPAARIYIAEPEGFDDTTRSLRSGQREKSMPGASSICDALLVETPGELTFAINHRLVAGGMAVGDEEVRAAMRFAFTELKLVLEPGGAIALAALLAGRLETKGACTVAVLSGGNADPGLFSEIVSAD